MKVKFCNGCKQTLPATDFPTKNRDGALRHLCKNCIGSYRKQKKDEAREREKELARLEAKQRRPGVTPPPTYNTLKDPECWTGWKDRYYVRNDGLKSVPSRGSV